MPTTRDILEKVLDPVCEAFTGDAAKRLLEVRVDPELQAWMSAMAEKANEGLLTADERSTYEYALTAGTIVSILQSRARATLAAPAPSAA